MQQGKKNPEVSEEGVHGMPRVCTFRGQGLALPLTSNLSPRSSVLSGSSPAARQEHRASCGQCGEPGQTQVLPREGCEDGCYFEGKLRPALSITCCVSILPNAFSWLHMAHRPPPPQPLCSWRGGSRSSPRHWCLPGSPSLLRMNHSMCRNCGQRTRAIERGCMSLHCQE